MLVAESASLDAFPETRTDRRQNPTFGPPHRARPIMNKQVPFRRSRYKAHSRAPEV